MGALGEVYLARILSCMGELTSSNGIGLIIRGIILIGPNGLWGPLLVTALTVDCVAVLTELY